MRDNPQIAFIALRQILADVYCSHAVRPSVYPKLFSTLTRFALLECTLNYTYRLIMNKPNNRALMEECTLKKINSIKMADFRSLFILSSVKECKFSLLFVYHLK